MTIPAQILNQALQGQTMVDLEVYTERVNALIQPVSLTPDELKAYLYRQEQALADRIRS